MTPKKRSNGEGGLYQIRGGKLWRAVLDGGYDHTGKRIQHSVTHRTKSGAREKLERLKEELQTHGARLNKSTKLTEWATLWIEEIKEPHIDPKTYTTYKGLINNWILPAIGQHKLSDLTPAHIRAVHKHQSNHKLGQSTIKQTHTILKMMLQDAIKEKLIGINPAEHVTTPKDSTKTTRGAFTLDQAIKVLETADKLPDHHGSYWWYRLLYGPRQGEALGATLTDLDLTASKYTMQWKLEELPKQHGCPPEQPCKNKRAANCPQAQWRIPDNFELIPLHGRLALTRLKTGKPRTQPLIPQVQQRIKNYLDHHKNTPNPHNLIWRNPDGTPINNKQDAQNWANLLHQAAIITKEQTQPGKNPYTGHWTRHTTVTILAALEVDYRLIGEIVGHTNFSTTDIYRHTNDQELRQAINKFAKLI